ncbi:ATP-dependent protease [Thioclava sediminum]|uniref:ATP-dependent protease n=2 Tax=Thioclava TaxID=285107 RepID=A0ABX6YYM3_9RHOB|nr:MULTISPECIES: LON peptidase substrate-binding domain-containing protein [Thioclava]MAQ38666.1 ATP-dependent protease [Thioclava sp.]MPQ95688.1 ATP-dependent protease [Thioclava sp. JE_KL1]OOY08326.1 ATP-dependent protease [Thioclava sp. F36-7]OOY17214.1 ATP-dependent protease [Thioclava sp. DLFJ4-1]OOY24674.1 ATP-dependent protease [Thioclava sediminum]|tara:strand:- start:273 stop:911 length:639 start_codon:yes stop_codon:yes gene_type:complete
MMKKGDLPEILPLFPLPGALLLPRARLPLHIFEPRYLQMIEDCMKTKSRLIGMIQPIKGPEGQNHLNAIGCAGRLTGFSETEDGRYMITLSGISRYRIVKQIEGFTPYIRAEVSWAGFERDLGAAEHDNGFDRDEFLDLLAKFFHAQGLDTDWETLKDADDELLINSLGMLLPLEPEDKQALLEAPCLATRRETLVTLIEYALHGGGEERLQ